MDYNLQVGDYLVSSNMPNVYMVRDVDEDEIQVEIRNTQFTHWMNREEFNSYLHKNNYCKLQTSILLRTQVGTEGTVSIYEDIVVKDIHPEYAHKYFIRDNSVLAQNAAFKATIAPRVLSYSHLQIVSEYLGDGYSPLSSPYQASTCARNEFAVCMQQFHSLGYLHFDINSSNVLYNKELDTLKLIDFGRSDTITNLNKLADDLKYFFRVVQPEGSDTLLEKYGLMLQRPVSNKRKLEIAQSYYNEIRP